MDEIIDPLGDTLVQYLLLSEPDEVLIQVLDLAKQNEDRVTYAYVERELRKRASEKSLSA